MTGTPTVPFSVSQGMGQRDSLTKERDTARDSGGTVNFKALAEKVLSRYAERDISGTEAPKSVPNPCPTRGTVGTAVGHFCPAVPQEWVEGVGRLDPNHAPLDFPSARWVQCVDDWARFLESDFAAEAARLGWGTLDLFGADRLKPYARVDHAGLLVLLNGNTLAELHRDRAVIVTRTGARQTFRRRPVDPAHVGAVWELRPPVRPPEPVDAA